MSAYSTRNGMANNGNVVQLDDLLRPSAYPYPVDRVTTLETHISRLFFTPQRVYKVKKSVDMGFLDYTTLESRRHYCHEEVRLNRRLAPDVYLGVVPICLSSDGHLRIGGDGDVVEWAVEMLRLPEHRMLGAMLDRGEIDNDLIHQLVERLLAFHAQCSAGRDVDEYGAIHVIRSNTEDNFTHLAKLLPEEGDGGSRVLSQAQAEFLQKCNSEFLRTHAQLLIERVNDGRIREGHGDLHAGNICLTDDGVVAYDCIEFDPRFRCGDVALDIAFLAMDLDHRGYPGFSRYLVKRYGEGSGDPQFRTMTRFYKTYRAVVRGKVAAIAGHDKGLDPARRESELRSAAQYLQLAVGYELPTSLVLMCGLPASGKSWFAHQLVHPLRASILRSDVRRQHLLNDLQKTAGDTTSTPTLYSPAAIERTYQSLLETTRERLTAGQSVIVDATFSKRASRDMFRALASELNVPCFVVHVWAPEPVIRQRMTRRAQDMSEPSEADLEVYLAARSTFEAPDEIPPATLIELISGEVAPEEQRSRVLDHMIAFQSASMTPRGHKSVAHPHIANE